jgi:L-asparaginase II
VAVREGEVVSAAGDPDLVCLFRSSAKPIQALPLVRARPDIVDQEIAIACSSHQAEPAQLAAVGSLLAKAPATEDDLECGEQEGRPQGPVHHNCSGKHAGFLAVCRARGWETAGYRLAGHPLQQELLGEVAAAADVPPTRIATAVDGCGVLTFALSLREMAVAFSRLSALEGADRVLRAMRAHPELVGGAGALDTLLMSTSSGTVAKRGAEGLFCGVTADGLGCALKSEDGNSRALQPALARFLDVDLGTVPVESSRGDVVGEVVVE